MDATRAITPSDAILGALDALRYPAIELFVAWGLTAKDLLTDWELDATDETARLLDISWSREIDLDGPLSFGKTPAAEMTVSLDNHDQRFSPYNAGGAHYSKLSGTALLPNGESLRYPRLFMTPVRVRSGFSSDLTDSFYGYIIDPGENYGASGDKVTLKCLDRAAALVQEKRSTALKENWRTDQWLVYMVENLTQGVIRVDPSNVDLGLFQIPYLWLDDENVWGEVNAVSASEAGYSFFDESGNFCFRNAAWWATHPNSTSSQFTFTVARFADLRPRYDWRNVATGAVLEYQSRAPGGEQVVWRSNDTIVVPPGGTTVEAKYEYPVETILPPQLRVDWLPVGGGGTPMDVPDDVGVSLENTFAQRCTLVFANETHETAFVRDMQLRGRAIVGGPSEEIERDVANPLVPANKVRPPTNAYIQTQAQANLLADLLVDRLQYPRLTYTLSGVPALPWLKLGDMITIAASEPITTSRTAIITKLLFRYSTNSVFTMDIDCIDAAGLFIYGNYAFTGTAVLGEQVTFR